MILETGEVHSNDFDKAMIDVLKQARNVGMNNTLAVYNDDDLESVD